MDTADKDAQYDQLYKSFSHLTLSVTEFSNDVGKVREQLHELVISQFNLAQNISDFYKEKRLQLREVERFKLAYQRVISSFWNTFVSTYLIISNECLACQCITMFHSLQLCIATLRDSFAPVETLSNAWNGNQI